MPDVPGQASPDYVLGWEHGFQAAQAPGEPMQMPEPTKVTWLLAGGAFLGATAGVVTFVMDEDNPWKMPLTLIGVSGLLLGALASSLRVLQGEPTPELGIKPPVA